MKKTKKILILIITIVVISIAIITVIMLNSNKVYDVEKNLEKQEQAYINSINNPASVVNGNKPEPIQYESVYLTVKESLNKYLKYCKEDNAKAITAIIDKQYINDKKTEKNTIKIPNTEVSNIESLYIEDMYVLNGMEYYQFYIKYYIDNKENYIELNQDTKNRTYSVIPLNNGEYEKILKTVIKDRTGKEKEIKKNNYNTYETIALKEIKIAEAYMDDLKEKIISNPNRVYELLDKEFREKNFPNFLQFSNYINKNKDYIKDIKVNNYSVKRDGTNIIYTCIDANNKKCIFKVTSAMKYTFMFND